MRLIKQGKQQITASHPGGTTKALDPRYNLTTPTPIAFTLFYFLLFIFSYVLNFQHEYWRLEIHLQFAAVGVKDELSE